jgi:hypothetical protein
MNLYDQNRGETCYFVKLTAQKRVWIRVVAKLPIKSRTVCRCSRVWQATYHLCRGEIASRDTL